MNILVTGAAGFMGCHLAEALVKEGHNVVGIDNYSGGNNKPEGVSIYKCDLRDREKVDSIFDLEEIDVIYHLAAYAAEGQSVFSPIEINDINIKPMNVLLVNAVNRGIRKFIFTSSMAVYGHQKLPFDEEMYRRPADPYGAGKAYCEQMLENFFDLHGLKYTILRPHNVYGPRQNLADPYRNVLGIWMNRIMRGLSPLIYGDGGQTRSFSYIDDVTTGMVNALRPLCNQDIINLGAGEAKTLVDTCKLLLTVCESGLEPEFIPERPGDVKHAWCTTKKMSNLLFGGNYVETPLEDGLYQMWQWAKEEGAHKPSYKIPIEIERGCPEVWLQKKM